MDLLQAEINRKRKLTAEQINEVNPAQKVGKTRYFRQGDVKALNEEKQRQQQEELNKKRINMNNIMKKQQDDESERVLLEKETNKAKEMNELSSLTVKEIKYRLRSLHQPVTLFGEEDNERVDRLYNVLNDDNVEDDYKLSSSYSTTTKKNFHKNNNDLEDDDEEEEDGKVEKSDDKVINKATDKGNDEDEDEKHTSSSFKKGQIITNYSSTPGLSNEKIIHKYFRNLLKQWEWDLDDRDDAVKRTAKGKMETRTQKQCKDYIRPLFKLCKNKEIPWDISEKLVKIVGACERGDFRSAHDQYLQAAIGKAAWPIGLTMVGIHERSGREKISTSKVAHVMNNELQRKYFTSVKRLMTYAQSKRTDIPPSMKSL